MHHSINWQDVSDDTSTERQDDQQVQQQKPKVVQQIIQKIPQPQLKQQTQHKPNQYQKNKNFPKPHEILEQLKNSQRKVHNLNINYCFHLKQQQLLEMFPMIKKLNNYRQGSYEVSFATKQDCISFVQQKIKNNVKFFLKIPQPKFQRYPRKQYEYKKSERQQPRVEKKQQFKQKIQQPKVVKPQKQVPKQIVPENILKQNKGHLSNTVTVQKLIKQIQTNKIFQLFSSIRLTADIPFKQQAKKIIQQLCQKINCHYQLNEDQQILKFAVKQGKKVVQKIVTQKVIQKVLQVKNNENYEYVKKTREQDNNKKFEGRKKYEQKGKRREYKQKQYLKHNVVYVQRDLIIEQTLKVLKSKNLFLEYGAIRFKTSQQTLQLAKQLIKRVEKQMNCQIIKQQISEQGVVFILKQIQNKQAQVKEIEPEKTRKKYVQKQKIKYLTENKIIITSNIINEQSIIDQIRHKKQLLQRDFTSLKIQSDIQFQNTLRKLGQRITKQFKWQKKKDIIKQQQQNKKKLIIDITLEESTPILTQKKQQIIDLKLSNLVTITQGFDVKAFIKQFKIKKNKIYQQYNKFRIKAVGTNFSQIIEEIQTRLEQEQKVITKVQIYKKNQQIQLIITQRNSEQANEAPLRRGKPNTTLIHDFLNRNDKRM